MNLKAWLWAILAAKYYTISATQTQAGPGQVGTGVGLLPDIRGQALDP